MADRPTSDSTRAEAGQPVAFAERLPAVDAPSLIVLEGHLAVRAQLERLVGLHLPRPGRMRDADLGFYHLLQLARASVPPAADVSEGVWGILESFNDLRNQVVHESRRGRVRSAVDGFLREWPPPEPGAGPAARCRSDELRRSIALLGGVVEGLLDRARGQPGAGGPGGRNRASPDL